MAKNTAEYLKSEGAFSVLCGCCNNTSPRRLCVETTQKTASHVVKVAKVLRAWGGHYPHQGILLCKGCSQNSWIS
eukprot:6421106-Amphidinium_carterae.1